jgi:hypothetical protein
MYITIKITKSLACYIASIANSEPSILSAIAKATIGKEMEQECSITISDSDLLFIYRQLTALPEGAAAVYNSLLDEAIAPLFTGGSNPALKEGLDAIKTGNTMQLNGFIATGLGIIAKIQEALNNN